MNLKVGFQIQKNLKIKIKKMIECIYCKSKKVEKSIMSPLVLNKEEKN